MTTYSNITLKQDETKLHQVNVWAEVNEDGFIYTDIIGRYCFYDMSGSIKLTDCTRKSYKRFSAMLKLIYTMDSMATMNTNLIDTVKAEAKKVNEINIIEVVETEVNEFTQVETIKVSHDKGNTWNEEEVNIKEVNPEKSTLKIGDWIERNGIKYEIKEISEVPEEHKYNKIFEPFKKYTGLLYASAIVEVESVTVDPMEEVAVTTIETVEPTQETVYTAFNRTFSTYDEAYNYCIGSDFDPEYIEAVGYPIALQLPITMDLQYFSSPITYDTLHFNSYDPVKLSQNEWEQDVSKHVTKYNKWKDIDQITLDDILALINNNYNFWINVISDEPYYRNDCFLIGLTLTYINKPLTYYILKEAYYKLKQ